MQRTLILIWCSILFTTSSCVGRIDPNLESTARRLPHLEAPIDTLEETEGPVDTGYSAPGDGTALNEPPWLKARLAGYPEAGDLSFVLYRNERFGYSIAYPDTLLRPAGPIGDGRGAEFVSGAGNVMMIVYAEGDSSIEELDEQYRSSSEEPDIEITYRARDDDFYVVVGRRGGVIIYEKAYFADGSLKTFRIQYPAADKAYFDAVTALVASSFGG